MNIGMRELTVADETQDASITVYKLYATDEPATRHTFGPHTFDLARDAQPASSNMPVIVISHGMQGTPWGYRGLTAHLVRAGSSSRSSSIRVTRAVMAASPARR